MSIVKYASQNNLIKIIELVNIGHDINEKDNDGDTALIMASYHRNFEIVKYLVQHDCLLNEKDSCKNTALIYASIKGHFDTVKYFVKHNAEINNKNIIENTSLIEASRYGHFKIVKYLVYHGAEINSKNSNNNTAIIVASHNIVKFFKNVALKRINFSALIGHNIYK